jgi:anti-sigma-K factor RskA
MTDRISLPEDDSALAGEYVLGVLDQAERAAFEARLRREPALAAAVARWESDLTVLNAGFAEAPAPNLLPAIEARLFGTAPAGAARGAAGRLGRWWLQALGGAGLAGALGVLAVAVLPPPVPPSPPAPPEGPTIVETPPAAGTVLAATLGAEGQALVYAARYDAAAGELVLTRQGGAAAETGRVHELWLIAGQAAPVSLGLVEAAEFRRPLAALPQGAVLAISLEPAGGSPTGAPTGPVLVTGTVTAL